MDQELLREYRTLHTLQRALEDAGKAADYLSRRLEQAGFRITGQGTAVLAIRDSALPGPAIGFGARLEMQDTPSGAAHTEGNDAACAMALTAAIRAASRLSRGRVSCLFWDGRETPDFFLPEAVEICLSSAAFGKAVLSAALGEHEPLLSECAAAVAAVLGGEAETQTEHCRSACGCRLGIGASPMPALGAEGMNFRKGAMEHGVDTLMKLFSLHFAAW